MESNGSLCEAGLQNTGSLEFPKLLPELIVPRRAFSSSIFYSMVICRVRRMARKDLDD